MINDLVNRGVYSRKDGKVKILLVVLNGVAQIADSVNIGNGALYLLTAETEDDLFNIIAEEADLHSFSILKEVNDNGIINLKELPTSVVDDVKNSILSYEKIDIDSL